jgi:curved DNA-binding protein CbpA
LARKLHPDLNPDDKEAERKFKELNEANEVLSNPENRKSMINTENTGNMVKNMKKLSNSKDNIKVRARVEISVADFPVLILVKVKIFQIFPEYVRWSRRRFRQKFKRKCFRKI